MFFLALNIICYGGHHTASCSGLILNARFQENTAHSKKFDFFWDVQNAHLLALGFGLILFKTCQKWQILRTICYNPNHINIYVLI